MKKLRIILISFIVVLAGIFMLGANKTYAANKTLDAVNSLYSFTKPPQEDIYRIKETNGTDTILNPSKAIYCLRGGIGFGNPSGYEVDEEDPTNETLPNNPTQYSEIGNMKTAPATSITALSAYYANIDSVTTVGIDNVTTENVDLVNYSFSPYNAILWITDNMYLADHTDSDNMKTKLLTAVAKYYSPTLTDAQIETILNNSVLTDDDIITIQQMALWHFSNYDTNRGEGVSPTFSFNRDLDMGAGILKYNDNNFTGDRATQAQSLYRYLIDNAVMNASKEAGSPYYQDEETGAREKEIVIPNITVNQETGALTPTITTANIFFSPYYVVGPFKIDAELGNIDYTVLKAQILDGQGTVIPATIEDEFNPGETFPNYFISSTPTGLGTEETIENKVGDGLFYIQIPDGNVDDLSSITLEFGYEYDYYNTTSTLWTAVTDPTTQQPAVIVEKTKVSGALETSRTARIEGNFNLQLEKVDENGDIITIESKFDLFKQGTTRNNYTTSNGLISGGALNDIAITQDNQDFIYIINETQAPAGYVGLDEEAAIKVETGLTNGGTGYEIKNVTIGKMSGEVFSEDNTLPIAVEFNNTTSMVTITVTNEIITGEFNLQLEKVDENGDIITIESKFDLFKQGTTRNNYTTSNGLISGGALDDIAITQDNQDFIYIINETQAPEGYVGLDEEAAIKVETGLNTELTGYEIKNVTVGKMSGEVFSEDETLPIAVEFNNTTSMVTITVTNEIITGEFNLQLEKVDENGDIITIPASFDLFKQGTTRNNYTTEDGIISGGVLNNITITQEDEEFIYIINETQAPTGYLGLNEEVAIKVITGLNNEGTEYEVKSIEEGTIILDEFVSSDIELMSVNNESNIISIIVENESIISGEFNLQLEKVDAQTGDRITAAAKFDLFRKGKTRNNYTTSNGLISGGDLSNIAITQDNQEFIYIINETQAPTGYLGLDEEVAVRITTGLNNESTGYEIKEIQEGKIVLNAFIENDILPMSVNNESGTITITVENQEVQYFDLQLEKVDAETGNRITDESKFDLFKQGTTRNNYTASNGLIAGGNLSNIPILEENQEFVYIINETQAPTGYLGLDEEVAIKIITGLKTESTEYEVKEIQEGRIVSDEFVEVDIEGVSVNRSLNTITITVENEKIKYFDLALRKYITKINTKILSEDELREPVVNTSKLNTIDPITHQLITTAEYTHPKDSVVVKKGDIVTYTIRIYNEGEKDGYASQVTDYLPQGLGLLLNYDNNVNNKWLPTEEEYDTVKLVGDVYSNESSIKNLTLEDFAETDSLSDVNIAVGNKLQIATTELDDELIKAYDPNIISNEVEDGDTWQQSSNGVDGVYYRDIQVTCIVLAENTYDGILKNIAEISEDKDANNQDVLDRDSTPNNVVTTNYTVQQEDDDDYEPLILKYFDLALRKFITEVNTEPVTTRIPVATVDETRSSNICS